MNQPPFFSTAGPLAVDDRNCTKNHEYRRKRTAVVPHPRSRVYRICTRSISDVANKLFFSGNASDQLTLDQFSMFVRLLQREALVMQFNQCDERGEGLLTATDFAKFLVTKVCVCVCGCRPVYICVSIVVPGSSCLWLCVCVCCTCATRVRHEASTVHRIRY